MMRSGVILAMLALVGPASADPAERRVTDPALGAATLSCNAGQPRTDYRATTESGVPLDGAYARERGADKGLVRLMDEGGRRVLRYIVPRDRIRAMVRVKLDGVAPDWADLIFTGDGPILVRTSAANAGVFIGSDVYRLRSGPSGALDRSLIGDAELSAMLNLGAAAYQPKTGRCVGR